VTPVVIREIVMSKQKADFADSFQRSLRKWGGLFSVCAGDEDNLVTPISDHVQRLFDFVPRRSKTEARDDEWAQIAPVARVFMNAWLVPLAIGTVILFRRREWWVGAGCSVAFFAGATALVYSVTHTGSGVGLMFARQS
jgi:hypothetical protein